MYNYTASKASSVAYWESTPTDQPWLLNGFNGTFAYSDYSLIPQPILEFLHEHYNKKLGDLRKNHIKTIGLYNTKAENVLKLSQILIETHDSEVPSDRKSLEALPGVGRKTANVVLNEAFGVPTIAVDTHIFRVGNRTGLAPGKTPDEVEKELVRRVPDHWKKGAHHWLILHGRYVCKARKPICTKCDIVNFCEYKDKEIS